MFLFSKSMFLVCLFFSKWGYFVTAFEWLVFVCTHTYGAKWKTKAADEPPAWVNAVMAYSMLYSFLSTVTSYICLHIEKYISPEWTGLSPFFTPPAPVTKTPALIKRTPAPVDYLQLRPRNSAWTSLISVIRPLRTHLTTRRRIAEIWHLMATNWAKHAYVL